MKKGAVYARIRPRGPRRMSTSLLSPPHLPSSPLSQSRSSSEGNVSLYNSAECSDWQSRASYEQPQNTQETEISGTRERGFENIGGVVVERYIKRDKTHVDGLKIDFVTPLKSNDIDKQPPDEKTDYEKCGRITVYKSDLQRFHQHCPRPDGVNLPYTVELSKQNLSQSSRSTMPPSEWPLTVVSRKRSIQDSILAIAGSPPLTSKEHGLIDEIAASLAELDRFSELSVSSFEEERDRRDSTAGLHPSKTTKQLTDPDDIKGLELLPMPSSAVYHGVNFDVSGGPHPMTSTPVSVTPPDEHPPTILSGNARADKHNTSSRDGYAGRVLADSGRACTVQRSGLFSDSMVDGLCQQPDKGKNGAAVLPVSVEYVASTAVKHDNAQFLAKSFARETTYSFESDYTQLLGTGSSQCVITQPTTVVSQAYPVRSESLDVSQSPLLSSRQSLSSAHPSPILSHTKLAKASTGSCRSVSWNLNEAEGKDTKLPTRVSRTLCTGQSNPPVPNGFIVPPPPSEGQKRLGLVLYDLKTADQGGGGYSLAVLAVTGLSVLSGGIKDAARMVYSPFHCCRRQVSND
ncbi:hypothetical protein ACOMHN_021050 [Nucella lapillus]